MTDDAPPSRFNPERHDEVLALRAAGKTVEDIAALMGVSIARVRDTLAHGALTGEQRQALARFPSLDPELARRLDEVFPDETAIRAASDAELLFVRGVGPAMLKRFRDLHPRGD